MKIKMLLYTPLAFSLLTPLGEGAYRLAAHQILEQGKATIEVVLPLTKTDYLKDFHSEESKREFEILLAKARTQISLRKIRFANQFKPEDLTAISRAS